MKKLLDKPILSIVVLNYNSKDFTLNTVASIEKHYENEVRSGAIEVIVADNASQDGSVAIFNNYKNHTKIKSFIIVDNKENIGFSAGNNKAILHAKGDYILFLNPDTLVDSKTLTYMVGFMDTHPEAGAATCKVVLPNGEIDEGSHRGFPTPWNAFTHFSHLEKLFPKSKLFAGYTRRWENMETVHTIPAGVGAFLLVRREVGEEIGWWDEDYFFYGEDLQFCYNIWKLGYKIYYVPDVKILHFGGVSSGIKKQSQHVTTATNKTREKVQNHRFDAMRIFYKKNYQHHHPILTWFVMKGIDFLQRQNRA